MRDYFTLDGVPSVNFGAYLASSTMFDAPERDVSAVEVPGRNGNLIIDNHRFKNFSGAIHAYIPKGMQVNTGALRAWLQENSAGYARYEDTIHPDEFRMARFTGGFALSSSDRVGAELDIGMDCKPQRWLKSGEIQVGFTGAGLLHNATRFAAQPLIRCIGQNGSITIGGVKVTVSGVTSYIILDSYLMEAHEGNINRNGNVTLDNGRFPMLEPGDSAVIFTGFSAVYIMPRWWTI